MQARENLQAILEYLPMRVRKNLQEMPEQKLCQIQEIRLRCCRPAGIVTNGQEQAIKPECIITPEEIMKSFQAVCSYSVYSYEQELAEGYITIKGGCRVGICGTAVRNNKKIQCLKYISSLNFRIAGEWTGIAENLWRQTTGSILLTGTVASGKTTYLRDLCRLIGNRHRTALIDERGELASMQKGKPLHDVGFMTDVLDGYPRDAGILTALRVLNPEYIICDEISTQEDVEALLQASGCGIKLIASCHAGSLEELRSRIVIKPLLEKQIFQYCVFLKNRNLETIRRLT